MTEKVKKTVSDKKLIIVESPHKAQTIGKFLGKSYTVLSSKGHIRDLPARSLGIDIENNFAPEYEISPTSKKIVADLRKAAQNASEILLASDPDREGEAIAWHLYEVLAPYAKKTPFQRIQYNEITPRAVNEALANPGEINMPRVDAQQARRLIDRIVGYKVSPFVRRNIKGGTGAAGRVQSVALRLVCEREDEINAFKPVTYWLIGAILEKSPHAPFFARLARINGKKAEISTQEQANKISSDLKDAGMVVESVNIREINKRPLPPFITSSLQRAASSCLGFTPGRTMSIAQKLYEGIDIGGSEGSVGLITYMRTDAPAVSKDAQAATLDYIKKNYGSEYCPIKPNVYRSGEKAQEAHEAIRPTDVTRTPKSLEGKLDPAEHKLYNLIWQRFVASQMASAKLKQRTVLFEALCNTENPISDTYTFSASTTDIVFPGFMAVTKLDIKKFIAMPDGKDTESDVREDEDDIVDAIPELASGDKLSVKDLKSDRKETKPPARYSEAALIDALEKNGIGRPSTYASIMETIIKHEYVVREKRTLIPTELGKQVVQILITKLPQLFNVGFTADMETELDKIEEGQIDFTELMNLFYGKFIDWMDGAKDPPADTAAVQKILDHLQKVKEWLPAEKRGRRTYDDNKLFTSIKEQFSAAEKPISRRQLQTLASMAWRYRTQLDATEKLLIELELDDVIKAQNPETPRETLDKLEILLAAELSERQKSFVMSVSDQAKSGRNLSEKQVAAIDRVFLTVLPTLDNKDDIAQRFNIDQVADAPAEDTQSAPLIEALSQIKEWKPAVKRGRNTFDDSVFFNSLKKQFETKGTLSEKQIAAMRKMVARYKDQISNADEVLSIEN